MDGIKLVNVSKFYTVEKETIKVLDGIDLEIPANKITIILGRSGCGKTTLLRLVSGLETFEQGEILGSEGNKNAYVFQEDRLMPWLNVKKNITFGIHKKDIDDAKVEKIIQTVGLDKFSNAYPRQLSGGMKQRVSIARAFAYNPDFIMMDEPFSALDFFTREQMQNELLRINKTLNCSILFVTHSIDEALTLGDKIVILEKGIIKSQYEIEEVLTKKSILGKSKVDKGKERFVEIIPN